MSRDESRGVTVRNSISPLRNGHVILLNGPCTRLWYKTRGCGGRCETTPQKNNRQTNASTTTTNNDNAEQPNRCGKENRNDRRPRGPSRSRAKASGGRKSAGGCGGVRNCGARK